MINYLIIGGIAVVVILICLGLAIASFAGENFNNALRQAREKRNTYGLSTFEFVQEINKNNFNRRLQLAKTEEYNDHYGNGIVALSEKTFQSNSLASMATVAHELGHAKQDAEGNTLKRHFRLRKTGRFVGIFFMPNALAGILLSVLYFLGVLEARIYLYLGLGLLCLAFVIFLFALILKYKEIQIEKEASTFALEYLRQFFTEPEVKICKEFLDSARLTYWANLFKTMLGWTMLTKKNKMFN